MRLIIIKDDIAVMSKIYDNKLIASFSDIAKVHGTTKTRLKNLKELKEMSCHLMKLKIII